MAGLREFEVQAQPRAHRLGLVREVGTTREADTEARLASGRLFVAVGAIKHAESFQGTADGTFLSI